MSSVPAYKVFLSLRFDRDKDLLVDIVHAEAARHGFEIVLLEHGSAIDNPARAARDVLERSSVEALLAVILQPSEWISNEIGMAYAFRLPVYVIVDRRTSIGGISNLITLTRKIDVLQPQELRAALGDAFTVLREHIQERRRRLPEPPAPDQPVVRIGWASFLDLIQEAHRRLLRDVDGNQQGFRPTLLLGISRGGIIVGDLLSRLAGDRPLGLLEADRGTAASQVVYRDEPTRALLRQHLEDLGEQRQARILVVDDVIKSGRSLAGALDLVRRLLQELGTHRALEPQVRTLVLVERGAPPPPGPDYCSQRVAAGASVLLPYGLG